MKRQTQLDLSRKRAQRRGTRPNPTGGRQQRGRAFANAVRLYSSFHGVDPKFVDDKPLNIPRVAMLVGKIAAIEYITPHNQRDQFRHEFTGRSRPTLAVSSDGKQLLILDGEYYFNDHGIIDGKPPE